MERDVDDGKLQGTMYGVVKVPAGHKHHCAHWQKLGKLVRSVVAASRGYLARA